METITDVFFSYMCLSTTKNGIKKGNGTAEEQQDDTVGEPYSYTSRGTGQLLLKRTRAMEKKEKQGQWEILAFFSLKILTLISDFCLFFSELILISNQNSEIKIRILGRSFHCHCRAARWRSG